MLARRCGTPYGETYTGPLGNVTGPTQLPSTEKKYVPKPTLPIAGNTPQPQYYSGVMPPVQSPSVPPPPGGYAPPEIPTPAPNKKPFPWVKVVLGQGAVMILLMVVLIVVLVARPSNAGPGAASTATSPALAAATATPGPATATPFSSPTTPPATATPQGGLPCNVDVGKWTGGTADWRILNGELLNDGTGAFIPPGQFPGPSLLAPCQFDNADYAVESTIQVTSGRGCFGFTVRGSTGSGGWQGYWTSAGDGCEAGIAINNGGGVAAAWYPGMTKHTYRVEVKGNVIKYFIDGSLLLTWTDNRILTGSQVGMFDSGTQLQVFSFQVTAL